MKMQKEKTNKDQNHRGRGVWRAFLIICLIILVFLIVRRVTKPAEEIETVPLPTVSVTKATQGDIKVTTELIGNMQASDIYYVTPKVAGEIKEIYVEQGQQVSEGDPICRIDNDTQTDSAKISLDSAQVALNSAQSSLDRMTPLYQAGDVSAQSYEQAQTALESARLQYEAAKLAYDTQVDYATVKAPVNGTIESENMDINAMVSQSSQLCVISGDGAKTVSFGVTDRLLTALSQGDSITVTKQGSEYEGSITDIAGMPNDQTGLYEVKATVADNGAIPQGANVQVSFTSDRAEGAVILPMDAVYYDGDAEPVGMDRDDAFMLDDMRLVQAVTDTYLTVQGYIRVKPHYSGEILQYFEASYPDGRTGIFEIVVLVHVVHRLIDLIVE